MFPVDVSTLILLVLLIPSILISPVDALNVESFKQFALKSTSPVDTLISAELNVKSLGISTLPVDDLTTKLS